MQKAEDIEPEKFVQYYDFSNPKIKSFIGELEQKLSSIQPSSANFSEFTETFGNTFEENFKLEKPTITKRSPKINPWITDGIIESIERKHELKKDWLKSVTKKNPQGNILLHKIFCHYRKLLKSVIKAAKKSHYCDKLLECKDDRKKLGKLLMK